jgi:hypothetical protein
MADRPDKHRHFKGMFTEALQCDSWGDVSVHPIAVCFSKQTPGNFRLNPDQALHERHRPETRQCSMASTGALSVQP